MGTIENYIEIRRDGRIIPENMPSEELHKMGVCKLKELRWTYDGKDVRIPAAFGILGDVVQGRQFVAVKERDNESGKHSTLWILNGDGSRRWRIPDTQTINGKEVRGIFCGFESPRIERDHVFGAVYDCITLRDMYILEIDADSGATLGAHYTR